MSQENVEIVSRIYHAWMAGDYETVLSTYDPEIRLNPDPEAWWVGVEDDYLGHEGVRRYLRAVYEAFEDYRPEVEQIIDAGQGRVLTLAVEHGRAAAAARRCRLRRPHTCGRCATERPSDSISSWTGNVPSKPWRSRSRRPWLSHAPPLRTAPSSRPP